MDQDTSSGSNKPKRQRKVEKSKLDIPKELKADQRRYLVRRISAVFDPKIGGIRAELASISCNSRDKQRQRRRELAMEWLKSCFEGLPKTPRGATLVQNISSGDIVYELVELTEAEVERVEAQWGDRGRLLGEALLLAQAERNKIADKVLIFRDPAAFVDLEACEERDYVVMAGPSQPPEG